MFFFFLKLALSKFHSTTKTKRYFSPWTKRQDTPEGGSMLERSIILYSILFYYYYSVEFLSLASRLCVSVGTKWTKVWWKMEKPQQPSSLLVILILVPVFQAEKWLDFSELYATTWKPGGGRSFYSPSFFISKIYVYELTKKAPKGGVGCSHIVFVIQSHHLLPLYFIFSIFLLFFSSFFLFRSDSGRRACKTFIRP